MKNSLITEPEEATEEWLTEMLRNNGCLSRGQVTRVDRSEESSYTSTIVRLALTFSDDTSPNAPDKLFLKLSGPDSKQRVVKSEHRKKEVEFHNNIVTVMHDPPIVRCHHAAFCDKTGAACLLFDDLSETHSSGETASEPEMLQAESAIDAFAAFHAYWWDNSELNRIGKLPDDKSIAKQVSITRESFPEFADVINPHLNSFQLSIYDKALECLPKLWERVSGGKNLTLIHGDANFSNVLLPHNPGKDRSFIIDWQLYGISFAAEDLAHLIPLFWNRDKRQSMEQDLLKRYHQGLLDGGVERYDWEDCWEDYKLAIILRVLFMPMWFWMSGSSEALWKGCLKRATEAVDDLHCEELLEVR